VAELPSGTVTFLFTDIEGSTRLLLELGDAYAGAVAEHRSALREVFGHHGGVEVDTQGDAFFVAFSRAKDALAAARDSQQALRSGPIRVRIGVHTGEPLVTKEGYVGIDVHRAARIAAAGHGGQILVSQSTRDLADSDSLRDLGEHRLKDLGAPERIYQLGDVEFPRLKSLNQSNLPIQPSPLIGRGRELGDVTGLVRTHRLLTLTGTGGCGKTRLALQAAADLVGEFAQGSWWISLAAVTDTDLVEPAICQAIGAPDRAAAHIADKPMLLLLDNFEQVVEAGERLSGLLATCPNLHLLVTSRARLGLKGEYEYPVEPLAEPDAVALFRERAVISEPAGVVAEICRRLDGLPLAIELAAARTRLLAPEQLLPRLERALSLLGSGDRDAPARQRTLRATIEWSHALLAPDESRLLARLGVFAGSFELESAEAVCHADLAPLETLLEQNLLRRWGSGRLGMLETIREFARERLEAASDADEWHRSHLDHFCDLAESTAPRLGDPDQAVILDRLEQEHDNFRVALTWGSVSAPEAALELAVHLSRFWRNRDHELEGYRWIRKLLSEVPTSPSLLHARALYNAGGFAAELGDTSTAATLLTDALGYYRRLNDERGIAAVQFALASNKLRCGDAVGARAIFNEAVERSTESDKGKALLMRGECERQLGDLSGATQSFSGAIALASKAGHRHLEAAATHSVGDVLFAQAAYSDAAQHYRQSLELLRGLESKRMVGAPIGGLAAVAACEGDAELAGELWGALESFETEIGYQVAPESRLLYEDALASCRGAEFERARERGRKWSMTEAIEAASAALA
jgi:predicted ATPase